MLHKGQPPFLLTKVIPAANTTVKTQGDDVPINHGSVRTVKRLPIPTDYAYPEPIRLNCEDTIAFQQRDEKTPPCPIRASSEGRGMVGSGKEIEPKNEGEGIEGDR